MDADYSDVGAAAADDDDEAASGFADAVDALLLMLNSSGMEMVACADAAAAAAVDKDANERCSDSSRSRVLLQFADNDADAGDTGCCCCCVLQRADRGVAAAERPIWSPHRHRSAREVADDEDDVDDDCTWANRSRSRRASRQTPDSAQALALVRT